MTVITVNQDQKLRLQCCHLLDAFRTQEFQIGVFYVNLTLSLPSNKILRDPPEKDGHSLNGQDASLKHWLHFVYLGADDNNHSGFEISGNSNIADIYTICPTAA